MAWWENNSKQAKTSKNKATEINEGEGALYSKFTNFETEEMAQPNASDISRDIHSHWADFDVISESDQEENSSKLPSRSLRIRSRNKWYNCKLCWYKSQTVQTLLKHMCRKHTFTNSSFHQCGFCQMKNDREETFKLHLETHISAPTVERNNLSPYLEGIGPIRRKRLLPEQKAELINVFEKKHYVGLTEKFSLARKIQVSVKTVDIWFRNQRSRLRRLYHRKVGRS